MNKTLKGFTLIELSIVLVIIGLIVGGILVGRDLVSAAAVRAQISQIEKYQTAVNTFKGKYAYLPADIPNPDAPRFGFLSRGGIVGNANGVIDPISENVVAWVDLSTARLVDGGFNTASGNGTLNVPGGLADLTSTPSIRAYMPEGKINADSFVYIFSHNSLNYFGIGKPTQISFLGITGFTGQGPTVRQAFSIDSKMDDGMPTTGNVKTWYPSTSNAFWDGLIGSPADGDNDPATVALPFLNFRCFDNGGLAGVVPQYSLTADNGMNAVCALAFKFQ